MEEDNEWIERYWIDHIPEITLAMYIQRLVHNIDDYFADAGDASSVGMQLLPLALIYLERICTGTKRKCTPNTVHLRFAAAFLGAIKFSMDQELDMIFMAKLAGVKISTLLALEQQAYHDIHWNLYVVEKEMGELENKMVVCT
jgi:hypothetical protein